MNIKLLSIIKVLSVIPLLALAGCAGIKVQTKDWTVTGWSCFKQIEIPRVYKGADGAVIVEGYKGSVDGEALGTAIGAAVKSMGVMP